MQSLYLLIPSFFIVLFIVPLIFEVRLTFNLQEKHGVICVYLFKIKLKYYSYQIDGKNIILKNQKEVLLKTFEFDPSQLVVVKIFKEQLASKARLKELFLNYNIGLDDAFTTAMLCGLINSAVLTFFAGLKNTRPTASMGVYDIVSYNREIFELSLRGKASISLFDVVYSCLLSVILIKRLSKGENA